MSKWSADQVAMLSRREVWKAAWAYLQQRDPANAKARLDALRIAEDGTLVVTGQNGATFTVTWNDATDKPVVTRG